MSKLLGNFKKGLLFVISAPAGTGKTTLVQMLKEEFSCIASSISYTTRAPREQEIDGKDYFFVTPEEFQKKVKQGDFLEYAEVFGNFYGTDKKSIFSLMDKGKHVFLVIDTQGALKIKNLTEGCFIFIKPPTLEELRTRLIKRRTEKPEIIEKRLIWAKKEIEMAKNYDYQIVNDSLSVAYNVLKSIVIAEEHRTRI